MLGFDICGYNDASGIGRHTKNLFASGDRIECLDVQSYYGADYRGLTPELLQRHCLTVDLPDAMRDSIHVLRYIAPSRPFRRSRALPVATGRKVVGVEAHMMLGQHRTVAAEIDHDTAHRVDSVRRTLRN